MKRLVCTVCSVLLCAGLLSGCGTSLEGEESVVYVGKKGVIASLDVETLDHRRNFILFYTKASVI